jgi:hypothetical protein
MSMLLMPELAREMVGSNRRVADSLEAESRQLQELRPQADDIDALKRRAARSARSAVLAALSRQAEAGDFWQSALDEFTDGVGDAQSNRLLQDVRDIIDSWFRLGQHSREMVRVAVALGNPPEALEELDAAERTIRHMKAAVEKMDAFLHGSRRPIDAALLAKGREDVAQGRFRTAEQIRAGDRRIAEGTE